MAVPALLLAIFAAARPTPAIGALTAHFFANSPPGGLFDWRGFEGPFQFPGTLVTPPLGPTVLAAARSDRRPKGEHARLAAALRTAAASALRAEELRLGREGAELAGQLAVAAAEATVHARDAELAKAFLSEVAEAVSRVAPLRAAFGRALERSEVLARL